MIDECKWKPPTEPLTRSQRAVLLLRKRQLLKHFGIKSAPIVPTRKDWSWETSNMVRSKSLY